MENVRYLWEELGRKAGVCWEKDADPIRVHRLVTSGQKTDAFFDGSVIRQQPLLIEDACKDVLFGQSFPSDGFDWVIGSHTSIVMSHEIARRLGARTGFTEMTPETLTVPFVAKTLFQFLRAKFQGVTSTVDQKMVLRHGIEMGQKVLVVDMVFNKERMRKVIALIEGKGAEVFKNIFVILNQSGMTHLDGRKIIDLIHEVPVRY
ncbi:TPA: hypothetical protein DEP58_01810 [Patescibacteria group bacterium]|nr:MAG: hypothetical protein UU98_C0018G0006 [Parcubacteria group bacterium GW2011_GWD2_42_14]HCC05024.1 hypothetical protein [Patescibacteria group bacterium]